MPANAARPGKNPQIRSGNPRVQLQGNWAHSDFFLQTDSMEFPPDWDIAPMEDFEVACTALAESGEPLLVQLLAQLHPTGRILHNFRLAVSGTQILDMELDLAQIITAPSLRGYKLTYQQYYICNIAPS
jgi:hypothetical protein